MNKAEISKALKTIKEKASKRNFKQGIDLIISLKGLDLKKPEHQINTFLPLHFTDSLKVSVCAMVGPELIEQAKEVCDEAILVDEFGKYSDKKLIKKLADKHDFFIAQANIMPKIATVFGRVFGPKGKMPNPKAGCVVPPNANLKALYERLIKTIRLQTKNQAVIQCTIGKEDIKEEDAIDNIQTIYNSIIHSVPNGEHNIKDIFVKLTMGPSVKVGVKDNPIDDKGLGKKIKTGQDNKTAQEETKPEVSKKKEEPIEEKAEDKKNKEEPKEKEAQSEGKSSAKE